MSYCKREGKDKSVFVTSKDVDQPAVVKELVEEEGHGILLPNGDINWDCPCLGGMSYGTCGEQFKEAFSCFHHSDEEEKGVDCIPQFRTMQECFLKYPEEYGKFNEEEGEKEGEEEVEKEEGQTPPVASSATESAPLQEGKADSSSPPAMDSAVANAPPPKEGPAEDDSGSRTGNEPQPARTS